MRKGLPNSLSNRELSALPPLHHVYPSQITRPSMRVLAHSNGEKPHVFSDIHHNLLNSRTTIRDLVAQQRHSETNDCDFHHFVM